MKCVRCIMSYHVDKTVYILMYSGSCKCRLLATTKGVNKAVFLASTRVASSVLPLTPQCRAGTMHDSTCTAKRIVSCFSMSGQLSHWCQVAFLMSVEKRCVK